MMINFSNSVCFFFLFVFFLKKLNFFNKNFSLKFYWSKIRSTLLFRSQASLAKEGLVELDAEVSTLSKTDVMLSFTIEGKLMLFN